MPLTYFLYFIVLAVSLKCEQSGANWHPHLIPDSGFRIEKYYNGILTHKVIYRASTLSVTSAGGFC